jgi:pyruvate kinase
MPRRTKIVVSLGPASSSHDLIEQLVGAGMDVARISLAHDRAADQMELIRRARQVAGDRPVAVLADLPGPKIRTGPFPSGGVQLAEGDVVKLVAGDGPSSADRVAIDYPGALEELAEGSRVGFGDCTVVVQVENSSSGSATATVVGGGRIQGRPGVHLPSQWLRVNVPTQSDLALLEQSVAADVDMVAASFVRSAEDVTKVREAAGPDPPMVLAKIETAEAVEALDSILEVSDGVMVARGDLGVRLPLEDVPHVQKQIIRAGIAHGRPVVTATQMLESMVTASSPTRAEVSDVANAVLDGTDAVMLSAETAVGRDPVGAVRTMALLAARAEEEADYLQWGAKLGRLQRRAEVPLSVRVTHAMSHAAWQAANALDVRAIVACTRSGDTARAVARFRPLTPMLAVSPMPRTARQLALTWGVETFPTVERTTTDSVVEQAIESLRARGRVATGDTVVVVAGFPGAPESSADVLRIVTVP